MRPTGWYKRTENFEVYVTHNGDLDYMEELDSGVLRTHKELGLWLQLVLQTSRSSMASCLLPSLLPTPVFCGALSRVVSWRTLADKRQRAESQGATLSRWQES